MKVWAKLPPKAEVESELRAFFELLSAGKLAEAEKAVAHVKDDWGTQVWSLWRDLITYCGLKVPNRTAALKESSFASGEWRKDLSWLARVGVGEEVYWDETNEKTAEADEHLFVNLTFDGEETDVSADFRVVRRKEGYVVARMIIHVE